MTKINIDDLTLSQIKEIASLIPSLTGVGFIPKCGYKAVLNKKLFIRSVTHYYTGFLKEIYHDLLLLEDVSWIPDTGNFSEALKTGNFSEVEPFFEKETRVMRGGLIDCSEYGFELPLTQK